MKFYYILFFIFISTITSSQYYTGSQIKTIDSARTANEGDMYLDTINNQYYIGLSHGKLGKLFPYGAGVCDLLKPKLDSIVYKMGINSTRNITLTGYNFSENPTVTITGVTINTINVVSLTKLIINVTTAATTDTTDIIVTNSCGSDTIKNGMQILAVTWKDLRLGGDVFTSGTGAGFDIRHRTGMTVNRNASGMYFTGSNPWQSWVKFESCQFTRGTSTTVQWIFKVNSTFMIGISGLTTNETNNSQYTQGAVLGYFNSASNFWGLYGSSPTNGTTWNQSGGSGFTNSWILKLKIENDGANGEKVTLYRLPSAAPADWDDESTIITSQISTNGNTQSPLVPFIIPRSTASNYFIALKVL